MKLKRISALTFTILFGCTLFNLNAQNIGDILSGIGGNSGIGDVIGGVIEGVFTKSNLSLSDLVGEYKAEGPAVTFKSENFLQKAGGLAGASKIESELKPYYEQYGLNSMTLTVDPEYNFEMKIKALSLKGVVTKNESDGTFDFNFKVLGMSLGKFTAYVEKSGSNLRLMFDATKLKQLISTIAKLTGNSMAKALGTILDSYEGACIGWKMVSTVQSTTGNQSNESNGSSSSAISSGLDKLKDILKGGN